MVPPFTVPQAAVAREMRVQPALLQTLLTSGAEENAANVLNLVSGSKVDRYMTVTLKNGQTFEIDDSDDGDEAYSMDPKALSEILAAVA